MTLNFFYDTKFFYAAALSLVICILILALMPSKANGFNIKLIPRNSIHSAIFPRTLSAEEIHYRIVELAKIRALHLRSVSLSAHKKNASNCSLYELQAPISRSSSNLYVIKVSIGSIPYSPYLLLDTFMDDTWVQCEKCKTCFPIKGGSFPYYKSRTFRVCACYHHLCIPKFCHGNVCIYNWIYNGGSVGVLSADSFTFPTTSKRNISFPNVVFGCGINNINITFGGSMGPENEIAGVFGLGAGSRSILKQLETHTQLRFSYCLPSWTKIYGNYTWLRVGPDAQIRGDAKRTVQSTNLIQGISRYYVNVTGITFDRTLLEIDLKMFQLKNDGTGGFAIDSGVGPSLLVPGAYNILKDQVIRYFRQYNWKPIKGENTPYDVCYRENSTGNIALPTMVIHFQEAQMFLLSNNVFQRIDNLLCLIFMPTHADGPSLLGAFQQSNFKFLFDVKSSNLSFILENCRDNQ